MKDYSGFVHGYKGNGTMPCTIRPGMSGMEITVDGKVLNVSAYEMKFTQGGRANKMLIVQVNHAASAENFSVSIKDTGILVDWRTMGLSPEMEDRLKEHGLDKSGKAKKTLIFIALFIGIIIGAFFAIVSGYNAAVRSIANAIPAEMQRELGKLSRREILSSQSEYTDEQALKLVASIGDRLEETAEEIRGKDKYDFEYALIDDDAINAFALPGGYIFINRGLIEAAESSDELASVIAHEQIHVLESHGLRNLIHRLGITIAASVIFGDVEGITGLILTNGAMLGTLAYGREQEQEADMLGLDVIYSAGFDPQGMIRFFSKLQETEIESELPIEIFSTHPNTRARIEELESEIASRGQQEDFWSNRKALSNGLDQL